MDFSIASILMLDGVTNGAIYALLGLATVLVFTVTRVIFIPQGEFVAYGALTLAMLQTGKIPGTVWLLLIMAALAALMEGVARWRHSGHPGRALKAALKTLIFPVIVSGLSIWAAPQQFSLWIQAALSVAIVTAFGPLVYRVAYQSLESSPPLVLLIVSVGVHFAMTGLGLLFFLAPKAFATRPSGTSDSISASSRFPARR
jgi:branched-chain amino acid transport system permease protein